MLPFLGDHLRNVFESENTAASFLDTQFAVRSFSCFKWQETPFIQFGCHNAALPFLTSSAFGDLRGTKDARHLPGTGFNHPTSAWVVSEELHRATTSWSLRRQTMEPLQALSAPHKLADKGNSHRVRRIAS